MLKRSTIKMNIRFWRNISPGHHQINISRCHFGPIPIFLQQPGTICIIIIIQVPGVCPTSVPHKLQKLCGSRLLVLKATHPSLTPTNTVLDPCSMQRVKIKDIACCHVSHQKPIREAIRGVPGNYPRKRPS